MNNRISQVILEGLASIAISEVDLCKLMDENRTSEEVDLHNPIDENRI